MHRNWNKKVIHGKRPFTDLGADKFNMLRITADGDYSYGVLNMIELNNIDMSRFEYGR